MFLACVDYTQVSIGRVPALVERVAMPKLASGEEEERRDSSRKNRAMPKSTSAALADPSTMLRAGAFAGAKAEKKIGLLRSECQFGRACVELVQR